MNECVKPSHQYDGEMKPSLAQKTLAITLLLSPEYNLCRKFTLLSPRGCQAMVICARACEKSREISV